MNKQIAHAAEVSLLWSQSLNISLGRGLGRHYLQYDNRPAVALQLPPTSHTWESRPAPDMEHVVWLTAAPLQGAYKYVSQSDEIYILCDLEHKCNQIYMKNLWKNKIMKKMHASWKI